VIRRIFYITAWVLLVGIIWYGATDSAVRAKGKFTANLAAAVSFPATLVKSIWYRATLFDRLNALELENRNLRAQLFSLQDAPKNVVFGNTHYARAKVYSTYPFNTKNLLAINAGSDAGIAPLSAVTVDTHLFLGTIMDVAKEQSVVKTIFDERVRLGVKIGDEGIPALLQGGKTPRLTLIAKDAVIEDGARVYTASREVPFGMEVGTIVNVHGQAADAFKEADLEIPYDIHKLNEVFVRLDPL